jgi:Fic-DOC domain mobile mystery protein B
MNLFDQPKGSTLLDPDEINGLKIIYINTRAELDRWELENIQEGLIWAERQKPLKLITEEFIPTLHKKMFSKVWKWAGTFRKTNKNIGVNWPYIPSELRNLIGDLDYWVKNNSFTPLEIGARFHHRLVWIHPFPNGNGRHARLITDLIITRYFCVKPFTWGSNLALETDALRKTYIDALKAADNRDFSALEKFVYS